MPRYFSEREVAGLDQTLVNMLDIARGLAKTPFVITSGFRTPEQNKAIGGAENSSHLRGLGVDLACLDDKKRWKMICGLISAGFSRIGLYKRHIHTDLDENLPKNVIWVGEDD